MGTTLFLSPLVSHLAIVFFFVVIVVVFFLYLTALNSLYFTPYFLSVNQLVWGYQDQVVGPLWDWITLVQVTPSCWSTNRWPQHAGICGTSHPSTTILWLCFLLTKGHAPWKTRLVFFSLAHRRQTLCQGKKHCSGHQGKVCSRPVVVCSARGCSIYRTTPSLTCYPLFFHPFLLSFLFLPVALTFSFRLSNVTALRSVPHFVSCQ